MAAINCSRYHATLSSAACDQNSALARRAALIISTGNPISCLTWTEIERLFICGRCEMFAHSVATDITGVIESVKAEVRAALDRATSEQYATGDPEAQRKKKAARDKQYRQNKKLKKEMRHEVPN